MRLPARRMTSVDGLAGAVLEVGEQGGDGVEVEAVDGFNLIARLHAGAGGGEGLLTGEAADLDGIGLHLGDRGRVFRD